MSSCAECERRARYMAADPEMYRGEDRRCDTHREIDRLRNRITDLEAALALTEAKLEETQRALAREVQRR